MNNNEVIIWKPISAIPWFLIAGLVLLVCKLTAYPGISWWWVVGIGLAPIWIFLSLISMLLFIFVCIFAIAVLFGSKKK